MKQKKNKKKTGYTKQSVVRQDIDLKLQLITLIGGAKKAVFSQMRTSDISKHFLCV